MTEQDFDELDRAALNRAIELTMRDPDHADAVRSMRNDRKFTWFDCAEYCVYHRQMKALGLKPFQDPPCQIDLDDIQPQGDQHVGAQLLRRMISHGVSRYDPDPIAAINAEGK